MNRSAIVITLATLVVAAPAILCPAWGQSFTGGGANSPLSSAGATPAKPVERREQAPPALPGARAEPAVVTPPSKTVMDMPPTEALFDAINRGDLPMAKDSVSRGADLNGTNVLGLTPVELAVDLGRNQISFYLLSLRGGVAGNSGEPNAPVKPTTPAQRQAADRAERLAAAKAERAERTTRSRPALGSAIADATPPTPQTPRLFSGGGGTPNAKAGFLGFDSIR